VQEQQRRAGAALEQLQLDARDADRPPVQAISSPALATSLSNSAIHG
jgi:hypothetical protein